jgi:hypothetical protein
MIKQSWLENGGVYENRKITLDLRDMGERCGKHRVYHLMKQAGNPPISRAFNFWGDYRRTCAPKSATDVAPVVMDYLLSLHQTS